MSIPGDWQDEAYWKLQQENRRLRAALHRAAIGCISINTIGSLKIAERIRATLEQVAPCPDHPTGRIVNEDGKQVCSTCGR